MNVFQIYWVEMLHFVQPDKLVVMSLMNQILLFRSCYIFFTLSTLSTLSTPNTLSIQRTPSTLGTYFFQDFPYRIHDAIFKNIHIKGCFDTNGQLCQVK